MLRGAERVCARSGAARERRHESEERNTNREGVAAGGATNTISFQVSFFYWHFCQKILQDYCFLPVE